MAAATSAPAYLYDTSMNSNSSEYSGHGNGNGMGMGIGIGTGSGGDGSVEDGFGCDPLQEIFQQFENRAKEGAAAGTSNYNLSGGGGGDPYDSSAYSTSGTSEAGMDGEYSFSDSDMIAFLANPQGGRGSVGGTEGGTGGLGTTEGDREMGGGGADGEFDHSNAFDLNSAPSHPSSSQQQQQQHHHQRPHVLLDAYGNPYSTSSSSSSHSQQWSRASLSSASSPGYPSTSMSGASPPFTFQTSGAGGGGSGDGGNAIDYDLSAAVSSSSSSLVSAPFATYPGHATPVNHQQSHQHSQQQQQQQQQQLSSPYNHLSPPSPVTSSTSPNHPYQHQNGFIQNEALARMIAEAQAKGQADAQAQARLAAVAQAAYENSFHASMEAQRRGGGGLPPTTGSGSIVPNATTTTTNHHGSSYPSHATSSHLDSLSYNSGGVGQFKEESMLLHQHHQLQQQQQQQQQLQQSIHHQHVPTHRGSMDFKDEFSSVRFTDEKRSPNQLLDHEGGGGGEQSEQMPKSNDHKKKRKLETHSATAAATTTTTATATGTNKKGSTTTVRSHKAGAGKAAAAAAALAAATAAGTASSDRKKGLLTDESNAAVPSFNFTLKSNAINHNSTVGGGVGVGMGEGSLSSSVDLIANAGVSAKLYKDNVQMMLPPGGVTLSTKVLKVGGDKKLSVSEKAKKLMLEKEMAAAAAVAAAAALNAKSGPGDKKKKNDKGHNAVERRYRNNINNAIATLRDIVPALRHLKPLPSMPASRRRASQFTLSNAAQAPTPSGLIDGIPAAKTLSKGTILGKSIEYIQYLQGAREDAAEDIGIFKKVILEMVGGGETLIEAFEQLRAQREAEREAVREEERKEQALLDEEEEGGVAGAGEGAGSEEEAEDEKEDDKDQMISDKSDDNELATGMGSKGRGTPTNQKHHDYQNRSRPPSVSHLDELAQLRQQLANSSGNYPTHYSTDLDSVMQQGILLQGFPPSPVSSGDELSISPRMLQNHQPYQHFNSHLHPVAPPRIMLAAFMGMSFAGGLGYDWAYSVAQESTSEIVGARAWAGKLARRAAGSADAVLPAPSALMSSSFVHPTLLTGLVFLGLASIVASAVFILYPLIARADVNDRKDEVREIAVQSRSAYRQRRRADALASLALLNGAAAASLTYGSECASALKARRELLKLVGAPTYGLLPALLKEALATMLRKITTIRVGSFSSWSEADRVEAALAWVRIAEIEATVGADEIHFLARCYTFLRLFNLSRSSHWPSFTSSISRPSVNAVLAVHLASLGQPLSAHALWNQAIKGERKKSDVALSPWVEIALSTEFDQVRSILNTKKEATDLPSPSDTIPLLRISEARCEAALKETWAKIFVAVVQTTCPPHQPLSPVKRFSKIVNQPLLEETVAHVLASTAEGTTVNTLAKVTRAVSSFYTGEVGEAVALARELLLDARAQGPISRLGCATPFFGLLLGTTGSELSGVNRHQIPKNEVDVLASTTLGWLIIRRQSQDLLSVSALDTPKADPELHAATLAVRRLLGSSLFNDVALAAFCAASGYDSSSGSSNISSSGSNSEDEGLGLGGGGGNGGGDVGGGVQTRMDLEGAQDACVDALTFITRRAAGLKSEEDSGVELDL